MNFTNNSTEIWKFIHIFLKINELINEWMKQKTVTSQAKSYVDGFVQSEHAMRSIATRERDHGREYPPSQTASTSIGWMIIPQTNERYLSTVVFYRKSCSPLRGLLAFFRFAATSTDLLGTEPISDFHQFRAHIEAQRTNPHNTQVLSCVW